MDPDSFAMSSYQFVNSLASCYPQSQLAQQQQQQQQHSQHPGGNQSANDYFANPTYNPNLYSPHYANQSYLATQQQQQQQQQAATNATDMVDYTQLQPQRMMLGGGAVVPGGPQQTPNVQAALPAAAATNSCKYGGVGNGEPGTGTTLATSTTNTATGPIASPQDLTTARDLVSPKLSPNSVVQETLKGRNLNNNNNNHNNSNPTTTNLSLHSPTGDSDTDSDSGAEDNDGGSGGAGRGGKKGSGSGPPTVYPWMKRVHLGQSK